MSSSTDDTLLSRRTDGMAIRGLLICTLLNMLLRRRCCDLLEFGESRTAVGDIGCLVSGDRARYFFGRLRINFIDSRSSFRKKLELRQAAVLVKSRLCLNLGASICTEPASIYNALNPSASIVHVGLLQTSQCGDMKCGRYGLCVD
jgi:hypothetical protein